MRIFIAGFLLLVAGRGVFAQFDSARWEFRKEVEGVRVYVSEQDALKRVRLRATVDGSIPQIVALLDSVRHYPEWVYRTTESRMLDRASDTLIYYTRTDFPWPLQDRDFVIHSWTERVNDSLVISRSRSREPFRHSPVNDAVRVRLFESDWLLRPLADGRTEVDYYLRTDPAGNIPTWIVNVALDRGPLKLVAAFRERLQRQYSDTP